MRTAAIVVLFLLVVGVITTIGISGGWDLVESGFQTVFHGWMDLDNA